jgi:hypothetical protein
MDGVQLPGGTQAGQVEISNQADPIDVRWHFNPTSDQARTFTLQYRVSGTTRVAEDADLVKWYFIPSDHEYEIHSSTLTVHLPDGETMSGPIGLTGADWQVELTDELFTANASNIPANQAALLSLPFPAGSLLSQPPAWQARQIERSRQTGAAFPWAAGLGLVCLLSGSLGLVLVWRNNHPEQAVGFEQGVISRPPDELKPALAGALFSLPIVPLDLAVATLMDLARRGWIRLEQSEKKKGLLGRYRFNVVREQRVADVPLQPFEQTLYDLIFDRLPGHRLAVDSVELAKAIERVQRGLRFFSKEVLEAMSAGQWLDAQRKRKRQIISAAGAGGLLIFLVLFFLSVWMIGSVGEHRAYNGTILMSLAIAGFAISVAASIMAGRWHVLTGNGLEARRQWEGFRDFLKTQIRSNETALQVEWLDAYLPFAVALRFGDRWAGAFKDRGIKPELAWLRAVDDLQAAHVMAYIAASSSSSGGAGGAGGGGGASGAG